MPIDVPYRRAMELNGLPLHPLVVHAAVILGPVTALTAIAYAVLPGWRWLIRWPMVALAVATAGAVFVSKLAGEALLEVKYAEPTAQIQLHQDRGTTLLWVSLAFLVIAVVAALTVGGPSALTTGAGARDSRGTAVTVGVLALVVVGALALLLMTVLTGDAGSRAVWGQ
jgi:MFS family permease